MKSLEEIIADNERENDEACAAMGLPKTLFGLLVVVQCTCPKCITDAMAINALRHGERAQD